MEKLPKKKVSFDIEQKLLSDVKKYCSNKNIKLADFFRTASEQKLKNDENYMVIFIAHEGKIKKYSVSNDYFEWDIHKASEAMMLNADAVCEGVLRNKKDFVGLEDEDKKPVSNIVLNELRDMINSTGEKKLQFYTKEKYCTE